MKKMMLFLTIMKYQLNLTMCFALNAGANYEKLRVNTGNFGDVVHIQNVDLYDL